MGDQTFGLFARPSFLEGAARLLDWGGTLNEYNRSEGETAADHDAFERDWTAVAKDLREAWRECQTSRERIAENASRHDQ